MKSIKIINHLIVGKIIEIICIIMFIFFTNSLFKKDSTIFSTLNNKNELIFTEFFVENVFNDITIPLSKTEALNKLRPTNIIVKNNTLTQEEYKVILKISKNTLIDYNYLNISINNKSKPLNTLDKNEDKINHYFTIIKDKIKGGEKEYSVKVWLDEKAENTSSSEKQNLSYEVIKSTNNL